MVLTKEYGARLLSNKMVPASTIASDLYGSISELPVIPKLVCNFILLTDSLPFKKSSLETFHAKPTDGKKAYLLFLPNLDEPS
ncbi:hypothetical protein D3C81_1616420 [compost metagenome]